jgi:hypothetical protein
MPRSSKPAAIVTHSRPPVALLRLAPGTVGDLCLIRLFAECTRRTPAACGDGESICKTKAPRRGGVGAECRYEESVEVVRVRSPADRDQQVRTDEPRSLSRGFDLHGNGVGTLLN